MKKLHLIRPRRMRAVRQNLSVEMRFMGTEAAALVPCSGPEGSGFVFTCQTAIANRFSVNSPFAAINAPR
jgi:hypothetical protein